MVGQSLDIWKIPDEKLRCAIYSSQDCNRQMATALWLFDNPDYNGYLFSADNSEMGLDPWTLISGVDCDLNSGAIILEHGQCAESIVDPNHIVYVTKG
jgi:hypothetical protein